MSVVTRYGDYHIHSTFCDGKDTPQRVAQASYAAGFPCIGFSSHAPVPLADDWHMLQSRQTAYKEEIQRLADVYRGRMEIICGIEADGDTVARPQEYAYVIGSVHEVLCAGERCAVDASAELAAQTVHRFFADDWYAYCTAYFQTLAALPQRLSFQVIGHFDLCAKYNTCMPSFDEMDPRYLHAAFEALDALSRTGAVLEINTGAIFRKHRTVPYPTLSLLRFWHSRGGDIVFSSDAHCAAALGFCFGDAIALAASAGYRQSCIWENGRFVPVSLFL